jgi:hypothetical protein
MMRFSTPSLNTSSSLISSWNGLLSADEGDQVNRLGPNPMHFACWAIGSGGGSTTSVYMRNRQDNDMSVISARTS